MLRTVRISEDNRSVVDEHSKDLKMCQEEHRTITGSRTRKAVPPSEISADFQEGVMHAKEAMHCRE